jgi:outer membrane protein TolC
LPAEILSRRPDLRAAELRLRGTLATADATRASYYPALSLTGEVSGGGANLLKLFNNPVSTITANLTLPFLDWNRSQLTIKVSQSQFDEAVVNFRQTLYAALSEVENALSNRVQLAEEARQQEINVAAARKIESGNQVRYSAGKVALKIWLDAQESRRQAEISLADARLSQLSNYVTLVKALGGEPVYP